ncbi:MAG: hypothetical protein KZQ70_02975 [gamma proteobacterium symbiont of Lucinoma myriamae]|nr:hypothetical protein [gamma proteobacterium symbiont of Lucinoma myriamae]
MESGKKLEPQLSKELEGSIAIAETGGGKVSNFAIEVEQRVDSGEITSEEARQLIIKHHCG